MVAIYLTGSPDIRWLQSNVLQFPGVKTWVRIDQGGATSPQYEATVFDAEPGAWSIPNAVAATKKCTAPRPTIYCDRNDYQTIPDSYTGDIWLAAPGLTPAQCLGERLRDSRIVAVQNVFAGPFDASLVMDDYWPEKKPVPPPVTSSDRIQIERYQGGFGWVLETVNGLTISDNCIVVDPGTKYRARVNHDGTWSNWQEFAI
jgi:hypothetical protein